MVSVPTRRILRPGPPPSASLLLIRRALRKHPGLVAAITILCLIAGLLITTALVMITQHGAYLEAKADDWRTPDAVVLLPRDERADAVEAALRRDDRVTEVEADPMVAISGSIPYGEDTLPSSFVFYDADSTPDMGRREVVTQAAWPVDNPVWAPLTLQAAGGYELGDELVLSTPAGERRFHIQGFVEATYGGMPPLGQIWLGVPQADYRALEARAQQDMLELSADPAASSAGAQTGTIPVPSVLIKTRLEDSGSRPEAAIAQATEDQGITEVWGMSRRTVSMANETSVGLMAVVVLLFSSMITAVVVLVLAFMLRTAIREDLEAVGMLRAMGMTTGGVTRPMVTGFALVGAAGALIGAVLSHAVLPHLSTMLRAQTGISWQAHPDPVILAGCAAGVGAIIWLTGALTARRAGRMSAVEALRGGQADHAFTRTRLPLGRTRGPLAMLLGLKAILAAPGRSSLIAVVSAACAMASVFSACGLGTLALRDNALSLLLGGVMEQVSVTATDPDQVQQAVNRASGMPQVAAALPMDHRSETIDGGGVMIVVVDQPEELPTSPVYEGRSARQPNEVVLGPGLARSLGLEVGDTWTVGLSGDSHDYLVTGLASGAANFGRFAMMTRQAYAELAPEASLSGVGVFVEEGADAAAVAAQLQEDLGSDYQVVNMRDAMAVQVGSYLSMIPLLSAVLMISTALAVVLVVGLMTGSLVARSRTESGLLKALGMTARQAAARVRWSILPPLITGTLVGCLAGLALVRPLLTAMLSGVGIMRVTVGIPAWPALVLGAAVVLAAVAASALAARPIARISAHSLMAD